MEGKRTKEEGTLSLFKKQVNGGGAIWRDVYPPDPIFLKPFKLGGLGGEEFPDKKLS